MPRRGYRRTKKAPVEGKRTRPDSWQQDGGLSSEGQKAILEKHNELFVEYYKAQKLIKDDEWDAFYSCLKTDLPSAFRIVENTIHTDYIVSTVEATRLQFPDVICRLDWYPGLAYQINVSRSQLRSMESLRSFHRFLVNQSEAGTLFRQEAVSMIPALFIPIRDGSTILDMCAAPGSKTSQIVEFLHRVKGGAIIANDACSKRGHMLLHHLRHLDSPALIVTNHFAQLFPNVFVPSVDCLDKKTSAPTRLRYSAILCDVPCSGDGTMRKSQVMWRDWDPYRSLGLHRLQLNILRRALELCENGGTVVYSTCSFNPLENEAVVNAALRCSAEGSIELKDVHSQLKGLKYTTGVDQWSVYWKKLWFSCIEDVPDDKKALRAICPSMFPGFTVNTKPSDLCDSLCVDKNRASPELSKCLRFLPHLNNTGGFFIAVFQKHHDINWVYKIEEPIEIVSNDKAEILLPTVENDEAILIHALDALQIDKTIESNLETDTQDSDPTPIPTVSKYNQLKPQTDVLSVERYFKDEEKKIDFWQHIAGNYGFTKPSEDLWNQLFIKVESVLNPRKVWFTTKEAAFIMNALFRNPLKVLSAGCLISDGRHSAHFKLSSSGARWLTDAGLTTNGLKSLESSQVAFLERETILELLAKNKTVEETDSGNEYLYRHNISDVSIQTCKERLEHLMPQYPCLLLFTLPNKDTVYSIPGWRGRTNVQALIDSSTRYALAQLLSI